jgi:predicted amidohydrolase YtcJ
VGEIGDGMLAALGPQRVAEAYRLASFVRHGIVLPGSSDRPVVDGRPLLGVQDMVLRRTESGRGFSPEEALTPEEAIIAYTMGSAVAVRAEHERGSIRPGLLADLVVLGSDPLRVGAEEIGEVPVVATIVGGEVVYRRGD